MCLPSWIALIKRASTGGVSSLFSSRDVARPRVINQDGNGVSSEHHLPIKLSSYKRLGLYSGKSQGSATPDGKGFGRSMASGSPPPREPHDGMPSNGVHIRRDIDFEPEVARDFVYE